MTAKACSVAGCTSKGRITAGLCSMHYTRLRRTGSVGPVETVQQFAGVAECSVPTCPLPHHCRGLCSKHYARAVRHGDPEAYPTRASSRNPDPWATESRFFASVAETHTGCWEWQGYRDKKGYALFRVDGRKVPAHRWAWMHLRGEIPDGLHLDHVCENPPCVNPWHLDPVTPAENTRRAFHGRERVLHAS